MKILHLTLKKKWFDMILSGYKREEYREIKPYWIKRLLIAPFGDGHKFVFHDNEVLYDAICFTNGYGKKARTVIVEYKGVTVGNTKTEWAPSYQTEVFVLKLGKILETRNIPEEKGSPLQVLKEQLGERRMKILNDNNLTALVQWAMIKYREYNVFELNKVYTLDRLEYVRFMVWAEENGLCIMVQQIMTEPRKWQCMAKKDKNSSKFRSY